MPGVFPTLVNDPDSTKFSVTQEDPAIRTEMEGGYMVSRARHTRTPRKTFKISYTYIPQADKVLLENFWNTMRGGSDYFTWTNPESDATYSVRFKSTIEFRYVGRYEHKRWDASFEVEEV